MATLSPKTIHESPFMSGTSYSKSTQITYANMCDAYINNLVCFKRKNGTVEFGRIEKYTAKTITITPYHTVETENGISFHKIDYPLNRKNKGICQLQTRSRIINIVNIHNVKIHD
jgi:hypothetical protein